jgi:hypothetical protein
MTPEEMEQINELLAAGENHTDALHSQYRLSKSIFYQAAFKAQPAIKALRDENVRMKKALEFYADSKTWNHTPVPDSMMFYQARSIKDQGKKAKQALKGGE